tara:strand:+ start:439 stop:696 length:258 start_codon:yes stop_codon:yes gene_type:complete
MDNLFQEKIKLFIGGSSVGCFAGIRLLFGSNHIGGDLVLEYFAKFVGTIILAFMSGLVTVVAHDLYKHKIKDKLFKKKKDEENKT